MKVYLSNRDYLMHFNGFLSNFDPSNSEELYITTHDKWVNVHPVVLTMVAALSKQVSKENIHVDNITATSGHYLDRMGLFKLLGVKSPFLINEHDSSGRFIPLTQIKDQKEQSKFITEMIPLLHLNPEQSDAIKYVVGELVRNVLEHAKSKEGAFVAAQYYPKQNMVRLGICDGGIGIKRSINQSWSAKSDIEAIKLSLTPGITGTTKREGGTEENAGAGLFFIKSMAAVSRDYFLIYSGNSVYKLLKRDKRIKGFPRLKADPEKDKHSTLTNAPYFSGTVVGIDISLNQSLAFTSLLSVIREVYSQAVRDRKKIQYKKPIFIN